MDLFVVGIVVQLPKRRRDILWIILKIFIYILRTSRDCYELICFTGGIVL